MRRLLCLYLLICLLPGTAAAAQLKSFTVEQGTFLLDWRDEFSAAEQQQLRDWLKHMGAAITTLHGQWPRDTIRIAFKAYRSSGPVPFGRILRNRPEGILFYVNPARPLQEFVNDWTAYHEFSHLFIPYPGRADAWFSEGLASYYQNILQVRAGVLSADAAYDRYAAAFQRGADDNAHADLTLAELSAAMMQRRAFMRVYWSGALYFLEADLLLRAAEQPQTLDDVLRAYNRCCLPEGEERRARDLAAEFDRIAATDVFSALLQKYTASRSIPDWSDLLNRARSIGLLEQMTPELALEYPATTTAPE